MTGVKGRFLKKLRFITSVSTLKLGIGVHQNPKQDHKSNDRHDSIVYNQSNEEVELEFDLGKKKIITPSIEFEDANMCMEQKNASDDDVSEQENQQNQSFVEFEEKCPPGGEDAVIFYTTSLRGVRETLEACNRIRFLLESVKVSFHERDVSMDLGFREELWGLLGRKVIPPRLFVKGRYIGGADEVVELNEQGTLNKLLKGIPLASSKCDQCWDDRFLICCTCSGSCKVYADGDGDDFWKKCSDCNENGLVKCPLCS